MMSNDSPTHSLRKAYRHRLYHNRYGLNGEFLYKQHGRAHQGNGKVEGIRFPTFASVEPVIGIDKAILAARKAYPVCDMFKVGLVSKMGVKFTKEQVMDLVYRMHIFVRGQDCCVLETERP